MHGKRRAAADTALRLARYFGTTDRFWLNLQTRYDLELQKTTSPEGAYPVRGESNVSTSPRQER